MRFYCATLSRSKVRKGVAKRRKRRDDDMYAALVDDDVICLFNTEWIGFLWMEMEW